MKKPATPTPTRSPSLATLTQEANVEVERYGGIEEGVILRYGGIEEGVILRYGGIEGGGSHLWEASYHLTETASPPERAVLRFESWHCRDQRCRSSP
jgi:hypothetical protein